MSFWPLAKTLTDQLRASRTSELVVELGSGEAEFAARLGEISIAPILLDRDMTALTRARSTLPLLPALCAVAQSLPFRDTSVGVVLCANLLRHCRGEWELGSR
jgi:ubiquinone/menaquinone biosynthesis C-methylase UbiE